MTESGKRYILTVVDFGTRYTEAVTLSKIDTETLLEIFTRVVVPSEVLSDQGSQFTSGLRRCARKYLMTGIG